MADSSLEFENGMDGYYYVKGEWPYIIATIETDTILVEFYQEYTFTINDVECILNKMKELQREKDEKMGNSRLTLGAQENT